MDKKFPPRFWMGPEGEDESGKYGWQFAETKDAGHDTEYLSVAERDHDVREAKALALTALIEECKRKRTVLTPPDVGHSAYSHGCVMALDHVIEFARGKIAQLREGKDGK